MPVTPIRSVQQRGLLALSLLSGATALHAQRPTTPAVSDTRRVGQNCGHIEVSYDRFDDYTNVEWEKRFGQSRYDLKLTVLATSPGRTLRAVSAVKLMFFEPSSSWQWLKYHQVVLLVDSTVRFRPPSEHDGDVSTSSAGVLEWVTAELTLPQMRRLARAKIVEIAIGSGRTAVLGPEEIGALREFLRTIDRNAPIGLHSICKSPPPKPVVAFVPSVPDTLWPWVASIGAMKYYASACAGAQDVASTTRSLEHNEEKLKELGYKRAEPAEERCTLETIREHERRLVLTTPPR